MMISLFLRFICSVSEPVVENNILRDIPSDLTNLKIPKDVKIISGESSSIYALKPSAGTLQTFSFENPSFLTKIENFGFYKCTALTTADFSECTNLVSIGDDCFSYCSSLSTIKLPFSHLISIGHRSFKQSGITSIIIPNTVTSLGDELCMDCSQLSNFSFQKGSQIESLPISLIRSCIKITEFTLPKYALLSRNAFAYCTGMQNYHLEDNEHESYIEKDGVLFTKNLKSIIYFPAGRKGSYLIPNGTVVVENYAFSGSTLSVLNFSETITTINSYVFSKSTIEVFNLPSSLKSIGSYAFSECSKLKSIILPDNLTEILQSAFNGCTALDYIYLPSSLEKTGGGIFSSCKPTLKIEFDPASNYYATPEKLVCNKQNTEITMYLGTNSSLIIKSTIIEIKSSAFYENTYIKEILFEPNSNLQYIYPMAFAKCSNLESFQFPDTLKSISSSAFQFCLKLKSINIPSSCTLIGLNAFSSCSELESVTIENHDEPYNISGSAFAHCSKLSSLTLGDYLDTIGDKSFYNCTSLKSVSIPDSCNSLGSYAFAYSGLNTFSAENSQIFSISDFCFYKCLSLSNISLPNSIQNFGSYSFSETAITNMTIPSSVSTIGTKCFASCHSLTTFVIPEDSDLQDLEYAVFYDCIEFEKITCRSNSFEVINEALYNKNNTVFYVLPPKSPVKYLSFPEQLETIQTSALLGCKNLEIILIPSNSVKTIKANAFENCINLRIINIPSSVETVGSDAFLGCKNLQCGLIIENRDESFISDLVKAQLPTLCLSNCIKKCTNNCENTNHLFAITLTAILLYTSSK